MVNVCYCSASSSGGSSGSLQYCCLKEPEVNTEEKKDQHASCSSLFPHILDAFLEDSTYCSDLADLTLELRGIAGPTERTFLYWLPTVDGPVRRSTDVEGVVHVVTELAGVCGVLLTCRQNFAGLGEGRGTLFKRTESCTPQLTTVQ